MTRSVAAEIGARPAPRSRGAGMAEGWATSVVERRREALDLRLPVGEQRCRRHEKMRRLAAPRAPLVQQEEAPAPGWSCRAPCRRPGRRRAAATRRTRATPRQFSDRAAACREDPRRGRPRRARPARADLRAFARARRQPRRATSPRAQPSTVGIVVGPRGAGEQSHALEERHAPVLGLAAARAPSGRAPRAAARGPARPTARAAAPVRLTTP